MEMIPLSQHLDNSPITNISPGVLLSPESRNYEQLFKELCQKNTAPIQMIIKKKLVWNKKDPLHFFQSLAYVLRSDDVPCIAVCTIKDDKDDTHLYISTNEELTPTQKEEITDILNSFLQLKDPKEIATKVLPRQLTRISIQYRKILPYLFLLSNKEFPVELSTIIRDFVFKRSLSLQEVKHLFGLILDNKKALSTMKDTVNHPLSQISYHLCKMIRVVEEIAFVSKKIKRHQPDPALVSLRPPFKFISDNCHAEVAILKIASELCTSKRLYIGVSKRPCYCCSLFFKSIAENNTVNFKISIVSTNGKLYKKWNRIQNCFDKEFLDVWMDVVEKLKIIDSEQKPLPTDDNYSSDSELRSMIED